jgi:MarR family transcriptional regulator, 2-MHQ and catechol-resistance regulon repressor
LTSNGSTWSGLRRTVRAAGGDVPNRHRGIDHERRALDAYVKLSRALATVDARIHRPLAHDGLTASRFGVLEAIYHLGPLNQREVGRKILKSSGNVTVVIDHLERAGLVVRGRDPHDRSNVIVSLTDAGRSLIEAAYPAHVQRIVDAFAVLEPGEVDRLAALAKRLGTRLSPAPEEELV